MEVSSSATGLAEALIGGAIGMLSVFISLGLALFHIVLAWSAPPWRPRTWRLMAIWWGVVSGGIVLATALIGSNVDRLLAPYVLLLILIPLGLSLVCLATKTKAAELESPRGAANHALVVCNRVLPLLWLIAFVLFVVFIFPYM